MFAKTFLPLHTKLKSDSLWNMSLASQHNPCNSLTKSKTIPLSPVQPSQRPLVQWEYKLALNYNKHDPKVLGMLKKGRSLVLDQLQTGYAETENPTNPSTRRRISKKYNINETNPTALKTFYSMTAFTPTKRSSLLNLNMPK